MFISFICTKLYRFTDDVTVLKSQLQTVLIITLALLQEMCFVLSDTSFIAFAIERRFRFTWTTASCRSIAPVWQWLLSLRPKFDSTTKFLLGDVKIRTYTLFRYNYHCIVCRSVIVTWRNSRIFWLRSESQELLFALLPVHRVTLAFCAYEIS